MNRIAILLAFLLGLTWVSSAQDTLKIMEYNVLHYGDGCQGSNSYLHSKLKTIVSYTNPDLLGLVKVHNIKLTVSDNPGSSPCPVGFADSIQTFALNAAYPNKYAHCTLTDNSENTANFDNDMVILYYNQSKLGFLSVQTLVKDTEDFNLYKLYYKDPYLSTTFDTTYLYVVLAHTASDGAGGNTSAGRDHQDSAVVAKLKTIFYHTPNLIVMGDLNTHTSTEAGYELLTSTSDTSFIFNDPPFALDKKLSYPGNWETNASYTQYLNTTTRQSATFPNSCGTSNGLKDWYQHLLFSNWIAKNYDYIKYVPNSYTTLGNDGYRLGISINDSSSNRNTSATSAVINSEFYLSDKYPVMAKIAITYNSSGNSPANPLISSNSITAQPAETTVCIGATATFSVSVSGVGVNYQWQVNTGTGFVNIINNATYSGALHSKLTINGVTWAMNGYLYRCIITGNATITSASALLTVSKPLITMSSTAAYCGMNNGSISSSVSGGVPNYTYSWSNGKNTATISSLGAGYYTLTVTDSKLCKDTAGMRLLAIPKVGAALSSVSNVSCYGGTNGAVSISATAGIPPYNYLWSTGSSSNGLTALNNLSAGNYTVTITDSYNCSNTTVASITQPVPLTLGVLAISGVNCTQSNFGSIAISAAGGTAPLSYSWYPTGGTSSLASNLTEGSYKVIVKDAAACIDSLQAVVPIGPNIIIATTDSNGTITPNDSVKVACGANQEFNIQSKSGFHISNVYIDGDSIGATSVYTFYSVVANHSISASFLPGEPICSTDINQDGITNVNDFLLLVGYFNQTCTCPEDINQDGIVNTNDFLLLLGKFNQYCY